MTTELIKVLYTAKAHAQGGRTGTVTTDDGRLDVRLAPPRKKTRGTTNPEQLFAAGYAACFTSALAEVAAEHGVDATTAQVTCEVDLGTTADDYGLAVRLTVGVPGVEPDQLRKLLHAADATCPYSAAVRGNIPVTLTAIPL